MRGWSTRHRCAPCYNLFVQPSTDLSSGKSYFLFFLLLECLSRKETVLFTSSLGDTFLFDETGVAKTATANFRPDEHVPPFVDDAS